MKVPSRAPSIANDSRAVSVRLTSCSPGRMVGMQHVDLTAPEGVRWIPDKPTGDGVLVLAGSSGRIDTGRARVFSAQGCLTESIRWFGGPGQHDDPWDIPLETFLYRVDGLKRECDRVWVVGTSFGAEAALLCGAISGDVSGVVAFAPSDVVWAGYDDEQHERSHWTLDGRPLPFLPLDWNDFLRESPARFRPLYERPGRRTPIGSPKRRFRSSESTGSC